MIKSKYRGRTGNPWRMQLLSHLPGDMRTIDPPIAPVPVTTRNLTPFFIIGAGIRVLPLLEIKVMRQIHPFFDHVTPHVYMGRRTIQRLAMTEPTADDRAARVGNALALLQQIAWTTYKPKSAGRSAG